MILIVQNDAAVTAGIFETFLKRQQISYDTWLADSNTSPPGLDNIDGIILLGGYMGVHQIDQYPYLTGLLDHIQCWIDAEIPILAICLGAQLLAHLLGGTVSKKRNSERGCCPIELTEAGQIDPLFAGIGQSPTVLQWHNDSFSIPVGAIHLASSTANPGQAFRFKCAWGVQFHPEVDEWIVAVWTEKVQADPIHLENFRQQAEEMTQLGEQLLVNFLGECGER